MADSCALTRDPNSDKAKVLADLGADGGQAPVGNRHRGIGKTAYAIFRKGPAATAGKRIGIAGEHLTGADDLGNMFRFYAEFERELAATRDLAKARALNPELQTFDQWLARNKEKIPLE